MEKSADIQLFNLSTIFMQ